MYSVHIPSEVSRVDEEYQVGTGHSSVYDAAQFKDDESRLTDNDEEGGNSNMTHSDLPWFYQPQYDRFWKHYTAMQSWMHTYVMMLKNRQPCVGYPHMMQNCYSHPNYSTNYQHYQFSGGVFPSGNFNSQRTESQYRFPVHRYHNSFSESRGHRHDDIEYNDFAEDSDVATNESSDESMEIEMSQEMIDFFKTSQKFREERDKAKAQAAQAEKKAAAEHKKKRKNHRNDKDTNDCRAPLERPDEGRRKEMKVLYGKDSTRIHGMETAMQMQFDRNSDRFQPAFWPIVALKL